MLRHGGRGRIVVPGRVNGRDENFHTDESAMLPPELQVKLHAAWVDRLRDAWTDINRKQLGGVLKMPVLWIDAANKRLGFWDAGRRTLGVSERHIWHHPWSDVVETLKHEMAHQYVSEVLGVHDQTAHGPAWAQACAKLGIAAKATGTPGGGAEDQSDRMLQKVRKLLALADSPNAHEAEAAMATAHALILRYNLDIRAAATPGYDRRHIGDSAAAIPIEWKLVASILSQWFFVECIWVSVYVARRNRMERQLEILGTPTNLELAHYAHDFLHAAYEALWKQTRRTVQDGKRRDFVAGVLMGFSQKLEAERKVQAGKGLVWVGDPRLKGYVREAHPHLRTMSGAGVRRTAAHEAGRAAGQNLRIHQGMGGTGTGIRGLLTGQR